MADIIPSLSDIDLRRTFSMNGMCMTTWPANSLSIQTRDGALESARLIIDVRVCVLRGIFPLVPRLDNSLCILRHSKVQPVDASYPVTASSSSQLPRGVFWNPSLVLINHAVEVAGL